MADDETGDAADTPDGAATGGADQPADDAGAEEAFALVGNEVRAEILRVLGERVHDAVSFSELRSSVDVDVRSSRFNYHLQQLVGQFVAATDDGYRLRPEGITLYRAIVAGSFTRSATVPPFDAGFDCYFCGARVEAAYEGTEFEVACPGCDHVYSYNLVPPSVVGDDDHDVASRVNRYARRELQTFVDGVCATCLSDVETRFIPADESPFHRGDHFDVFVKLNCDHCGARRYMSVGTALLGDPGLVSFCFERGLDLTATPTWELEFAMTDQFTTVRSRDPWEVALEVALDGDALELVVNDDLDVVERNYS